MSFDPGLLLLSLVASGVGFVLFVYGRKQERWPHLVAGVVFMIYPYFTDSVLALLATGGILGVALWYVLWLGW